MAVYLIAQALTSPQHRNCPSVQTRHCLLRFSYGRLTRAIMEAAEKQSKLLGEDAHEPLSAEDMTEKLNAAPSFDVALHDLFGLSESRMTIRGALEAALKSGEWRLNRTPFHFAALWYGEDSATYKALCEGARRLGLDVDSMLDMHDNFGAHTRKTLLLLFQLCLM